VCADAFEQDGFRAFVLYELEDHAQIVTGTARPRAGEFAFQFVRLELRMKSVFGQKGPAPIAIPAQFADAGGQTAARNG
jgi:hypothetical protein